MPTIRRKLISQRLYAGLSPQLRLYLELGDYTGGPEHPADVDVFRLAGGPISGDFAALAKVWAQHADEIMGAWLVEAPGYRPFAWWAVVAPEPRRVVRGAALLKPPGPIDARWWRSRSGVPRFIAVRPRGAALPLLEAEPAYLDRLGLLSVDERRALDDDAFAPEAIDPFQLAEAEG
jgi:hypothetical protein